MIKKIFIGTSFFLTFLLGHSTSVFSEQLTLNNCIQQALKNNSDIINSEYDIDSAKAKIGEAWATVFPKLSASATGTKIHSYELKVSNPTISPEIDAYSYKLNFSQILFGLHVLPSLKAADLVLDLADLSQKSKKNDLVVKITEAFYGCLKAEKFYDTMLDGKKTIEKLMEQTKEMLALNAATKIDLLRLQQQQMDLESNIISAENALIATKALLNNLIGNNLDQKFNLVQPEYIDFQEKDLAKLTELEGQVQARRPEIKLIDIQKELYQVQKDVLFGTSMPMAFFNGYYQLITDELKRPDLEANKDWMVALGVNWSLFDGGTTGAKIKDTEVTIAKLKNQKAALLKGIDLEIMNARNSLVAAIQKIKAAKKGQELAEEALAITQEKYLTGAIASIEIVQSQNSLLRSKMNLYNAIFDLEIARSKFYKAVGISTQEEN